MECLILIFDFFFAEFTRAERVFGEAHSQTKHWIPLVERCAHRSSAELCKHGRITVCRCTIGTISSTVRVCLSRSRC